MLHYKRFPPPGVFISIPRSQLKQINRIISDDTNVSSEVRKWKRNLLPGLPPEWSKNHVEGVEERSDRIFK